MVETFDINNRRYLGNKYKLLPFIKDVINTHCGDFDTFFDVFAGTGSVSSAFLNKRLIVNDLMYSNYLAALTWFSPITINRTYLKELLEYYNSVDTSNELNYMSQNFANTYFSEAVCQRIGFIRDDIEAKFLNNLINERERAILVTSLIYAMDRIAHTCGHYDSFIQDGNYDDSFNMRLPNFKHEINPANECYNLDANVLAPNIECDIAYLDPPYNGRQYCDAYHLIENIARWEKPAVFGIAKKMNRQQFKSGYCRATANEVFEDLISHLNCRFIILSYNNNGQKLQMRSNAKIADEEIMRILRNKGKVEVFEQRFRPFSAGKSDIQDNIERLFLCRVG